MRVILDTNVLLSALITSHGPPERFIVLGDLPSLPESIDVNDPNDAFLFSMAMIGVADYLVTGDRHSGLLQRGRIGHTRVVTPTIFCTEAL